MPVFDYQCDSCSHQMLNVLVGTYQDYPAPTQCIACDSQKIRKLMSFRGFVSKTQFETDGDRAMHLQHKEWVEELGRNDQITEIKEQGPLEFRPQFDRKYH